MSGIECVLSFANQAAPPICLLVRVVRNIYAATAKKMMNNDDDDDDTDDLQ